MAESVVVDADVALAWVGIETDREEQRDYARKVLLAARNQPLRLIVPNTWHVEVCLVLMGLRRQKSIGARALSQALDLFDGLDIGTPVLSPSVRELAALARRYHLQPGDAMYFDLARRLDLPIASNDNGVRTACKAHRVEFLAPSA